LVPAAQVSPWQIVSLELMLQAHALVFELVSPSAAESV
jgi:hypothetical protein